MAELQTFSCPSCAAPALRPDVVWFGEVPYHLDEITAAVTNCEIFAAIGTSGAVYPAAGLAGLARDSGATTVLLNLEPNSAAGFDEVRLGPASQIVPAWCGEISPSHGLT